MKSETDIVNETDKIKRVYEDQGGKSADSVISPGSNISIASKAKGEPDEKSNTLALQ